MALKPQELDHSKRKTKVVASLGPASWSEEMIPKMIEAGTDIFRLNCSHRRGGDFERVYPLIRKYARMLGRRVEVLGDLQGPKFRVGELAGDPVPLVDGEVVEFGICKDDNDLIKPGRITMKPTKEQLALVKACKVGIDLLIEDGIMKVNVVEKVSDTELKVKVVRGGKLKARKGVNVPDCEIDCAALTEKDIEDAEYLLQLDPPVEYICVSFAQKGQDLQELVDIMDRLKVPAEKRPKICPKIEKPQALTNIEGIIEKSQALMVARGDLGVELELERVPFAQKLLIARAKKAGLFVINATQMVESMIENPVPTRAEVSDLQNAVFDGCDAVMLSGEAASGKFPCESVKAEADAALEAETVRDFLKPQVLDGVVVDEANKPRELDDSKRATKVVASLGPASWSEEMIPKMIEAGTNIFRLNCSHRRGGDFERVYPLIRKCAKEMGKTVECLGDLQGPKFRVGELAGDPVELKNGDVLEFGISKDDNDNIRPGRITMKPTTEQTALVKDGIMEVMVVEKCSESELKVEVTRGGKLKARKGVNVPDVEIDCAALTEKDIEDAEFLLKLDPPIEYICVSFAQKGQDLQELIDIMDRLKEKPQAFTNIEGIIEKSQALMVARGDLGVELGLCRVPFAQKLLIQRAKQAGLFVITATQMVESMIENPVPTRAEVSDLMNAVWDGTDAVMLSGEAASGKYPCEAVMAEASATREAETVKHRLQQACPFVAINSKMPLRPPKMLNCGMGLKRQETDHSKRKTKVVASLGPASWSEEMIPKMIEAGTDIFRLNCSHRRGGDFERVYPLIRKAAKELGKKVECLGDLQGPKFRVGELAGDPIPLKDGEVLEFGICKDDNDMIRPGRITMKPTTEQNALVRACKPGTPLLLEDGIMEVKVVEKCSDTELKVQVVRGGKLKARKGVNVPEVQIDCAALTEKDIEDAEFLLKLDPPIEYICVSFVQKAEDLQELINIMDRLQIPQEKRPKICPKIEKPQALTNIEGIIAKSQALMVARGDLGVELELERVPFAQKLLIRRAKDAGLFVINATQMVESMIEQPVPTRAEVSDLQNAVWDGADAVMLSGEAASGKYPCEAVRAEADAALEAESVKHLLVPQVYDDYVVDEANKPRELDDSRRRTKIVASLGPASWSDDMLAKMIQAGTDIFRLNCSHRRVYPAIRRHSKELGVNVECLGDLQGPKFRVGELAGDPIELKNGDVLEFGICKDDNDLIKPGRITMKPTVEQNALVEACKVGTLLLIEDGLMEVKEKISATELRVEVTRGGKLKARKGVNVPDLEIDCAALTAKDIEDAEYLLQLEYICVSFVQKGQDLQELIDIMDRLKIPPERRPKICPKIEKPQALTNIDGIIAKSQALMVARGDLGVELGLNRVPFAQKLGSPLVKLLIARAKQAGLFVINATQVVESMIKNPVPTRAEVSDVCNAVWDGADAVMLSGEAASGDFPCEAVMAEASAAREAESVKHRLRRACPPVESGAIVAPMLHVSMGNKKQETNHSLRKSKVVASLGPASWSEEMIPKMIEAGTDIFRLNCSHRRGGDFERVYPLIRKAAKELGKKVECLGDLQGPKFRVGELAGDPIQLNNGDVLEFGISKDDNDNIRPGRITMKPTTEQNALIAAAKVGTDLLLEDGIMKVNVVEKLSDTELKVKVVRGGKLKARKGVNVPDVEIDCAALTTKDIEDAEFLLQLDPPIEYICVSFVQKGQDLQELIDIMDRLNIPQEKRPKICPKIEKPQALTNIDGIIAKSQALMVARGDLGVELELERVPFAQKLLIRKAKDAGLFVINATQMVESMIENPVPTRAEVSDLQNAIWDGADAVMLSGEAASGKYPCESVAAEAAAALEAESVKDLLMPRLGIDYCCDEGNKPREMDDSKRRTKVVASLGPASWSEEMIPKMIEAGTDIFRLNCSHRRGGDFERVYPLIRKAAKELGKKVECLGDLQGPKFRVGELAGDPIPLENGDVLEFGISKDDNDNIRPGRITMKPTTEQNALVKGCQVGTTLLIEDGIMEVSVVEKLSDTELKVKVVRGGKLKARKGVNVPDIEIDCAALTVKDIEDAEFLLQLDPPIEYICVSFAQKKQDLQELIDIMDRLKIPAEKRPKICPKIEKPQALTNIEGIIEKSQALMVARGDLGVELGLNRVPFAQKLLIKKAKDAGLFVITATQMVESMIEAPVPTRAEVSDLCNAVWDGTDAVMLSGEAASGKYPLEAVMAEASAAREAESVEHRLFPAASEVRGAMQFTWKGYREKAWGHDEVMAASGRIKDWCKMAITMLDGLSTLWLMGLEEEFNAAADYLERAHLPTSEKHGQHSLFEINIRAFAGLLSAYSLSGKQVFLDTAKRLGEKLLKAFDTPSGMPMPTIDIGTGEVASHSWNQNAVLAEVTTLQVEFRFITQVTGDRRWQYAADKEISENVWQIAGAVLTAILKICSLIAVGVHLERRKLLNGEKRKCLSALAMDVCLPCLLFTDVLPEANFALLLEGWQLLLWPFAYASVSAVLGMLCCLVIGIPSQHMGAAAACAAFPNVNGFPVSVISALGKSIPKSPAGFSPMVFLSIIQLTDGLLKYTVGPAVFRRDKRQRASMSDLPLGGSLHSIEGPGSARHLPGTKDLDEQGDAPSGISLETQRTTDFGLTMDQVHTVEPDWSRFDAYKVFSSTDPMVSAKSQLREPFLKRVQVSHLLPSASDVQDLLRQVVPPQVSAVLLALAIGMGPPAIKDLLVGEHGAYLAFVFGTAKELGKGFVPLQMISLGGRMLNVVAWRS
ncbi:pyk1 [Symbiodinium natans]|uniref:Pyruvate kinase n=1 Tax=Symbiodinium natans TaxID=878477 RepID=A0A812MR76_9DINO|nr:pyk1 [Symbiodinium natans]